MSHGPSDLGESAADSRYSEMPHGKLGSTVLGIDLPGSSLRYRSSSQRHGRDEGKEKSRHI